MLRMCMPCIRFLAYTVPLSLVLIASEASAQEVTLCNDGFSAGEEVAFQGGFAGGEAAAVKVSAPADGYPFTINKVQLLFGGGNEGDGFNVTLRIFDDDGVDVFGGEGFPGAVALYEQTEVGLLDSTEQVNEATLTTPHVVNDGAVWIAVFVDHNNAPGVANDTDGTIDGTRNAIFSGPTFGGWIDADTAGIAGDWVIRAVVDSPTASANAACVFTDENIGEGEGEGEGGEGEGEGEGEGGDGEGEGEPDGLFITSVNPNTAVEGASARVTITGGDFDDDTAFRVGAEPCDDAEVLNEGAALCSTSAALVAGSYDVIAQKGAETFVFPSGFTVTAGGCACSSSTRNADALVISALALLSLVSLRMRRR